MQTVTIDEGLLNRASQAFGLSADKTVEKGLRLLLALLEHQNLLEDMEDIEDIREVLTDLEAGRETLIPWHEVKQKAGL